MLNNYYKLIDKGGTKLKKITDSNVNLRIPFLKKIYFYNLSTNLNLFL